MPPLDIGQWVAEVSPEQPAGPNLEFDQDFGALDRAAQGKAEQQFGDTVIPAEEPVWKEVEAQAWALLERTRDLRVLTHLAVARLHLSGLPGFADALALIRQLLETQWDSIHPQLDPDDDNDPTLRANALLRLAEPGRVLRAIRDLPLASSQKIGRITWRDIAVQAGSIEADPGRQVFTEKQIRSTFAETDLARLAELREALASAARDAAAIPAVFDARAGFGTGPELKDLLKLLREVAQQVEAFGGMAGAEESPAEEMPTETDAGTQAGGSAAVRPSRGVTAASITAVTSRADAVRLLELVVQYYEQVRAFQPAPAADRARTPAGRQEFSRHFARHGPRRARASAEHRRRDE